MSRPGNFTLTPQLAVQYGGGVLCLDDRGMGRTYKLHPHRPDARLNRRVDARAVRNEVINSDGTIEETLDTVIATDEPVLTYVYIMGPLEQRSGYHDMCGGWSDGHDAVADRLCEAFEQGNVVLVIDSPGGAAAGLSEAIRRTLEVKEEYARRCEVYADELIGSAAYWWAACVGDSIHGPGSMIVGSIGARSGHQSIAGHLANEGIVVTYFAAPGPGKVCFAPELPLSDLAKERGERDTWMAFEQFAAAVTEHRGLTRDEIVELDADALIGQLAVDAGLADGIASLEDVTEYALTVQGEKDDMADENTAAAENTAPQARAEGDDKETPEPPPADKAECAECGAANEDDAKYCDKCGGKMPGMEETRAEDDAQASRASAPPSDSSAPPPDKKESLAAIVGLPAKASNLAIKSAVLNMKRAINRVQQLTGTQTLDAMIGAVIAQADDSKALAAAVEQNRTQARANAQRERVELLRKLASANVPGYTRGELFVDEVADDGTKSMKPAKQYAEMKLGTLREIVKAKTSSVSAAPKSPFEPQAPTGAHVTNEDRQIASKNGYDPEAVAASRNALFANQGA